MEQIDNRFELVLTAARRARQIEHGSEALLAEEGDKPSVLALREIADDLIDSDRVRELQAELEAAKAAAAAEAAQAQERYRQEEDADE